MPTEEYNSGRPHQGFPQGVLALMPPLKILVTTVGAALLVCGLLFAYLSSPAWAADMTVTTTADELNADGDCSLREAIEAANTNAAVDGCAAGSDTERDAILFAVGQEATITLVGSQLPPITDSAGLIIDGGSAKITVSGNNAVRVFEVGSGAELHLNRLTVANGSSSFFGGGIYNAGPLTVSNSTFSGNSAAPGGAGAIYNADTLTVSNSTFSGNSSQNGGAIRNDGTMTVTNSTFSGNSFPCCNTNTFGGAIYNAGPLTVSNSTFSGNSAGDAGGGIYNDFGRLTVSNSTFSDNSVAGDNGGGGIFHSFDTLTVSNSTFSGNSAAQSGGGILSFDTLTVSNSTFSGNSAAGSNGGGGIRVGFSTATLKNTIIANSTQGGDCTKGSSGTIVDGGYNLDSGTSCGFTTENNSLSSTDPMLGPLADNGGPTKTHALLEGSPAIGKGNNAFAVDANGNALQFDQRGEGFARIVGASVDIGAFEVQSLPDTTAPRVTNTTVPAAGATSVALGVNVKATFTEAMDASPTATDGDPSTIKGTTFKLMRAGTTTVIGAVVSYDATTKIATLNPNANLLRGTKYKAVVTTGAEDLAGNRLDQNSSQSGLQQKSWTFTTRN